jgi:hypothetical protein
MAKFRFVSSDDGYAWYQCYGCKEQFIHSPERHQLNFCPQCGEPLEFVETRYRWIPRWLYNMYGNNVPQDVWNKYIQSTNFKESRSRWVIESRWTRRWEPNWKGVFPATAHEAYKYLQFEKAEHDAEIRIRLIRA